MTKCVFSAFKSTLWRITTLSVDSSTHNENTTLVNSDCALPRFLLRDRQKQLSGGENRLYFSFQTRIQSRTCRDREEVKILVRPNSFVSILCLLHEGKMNWLVLSVFLLAIKNVHLQSSSGGSSLSGMYSQFRTQLFLKH